MRQLNDVMYATSMKQTHLEQVSIPSAISCCHGTGLRLRTTIVIDHQKGGREIPFSAAALSLFMFLVCIPFSPQLGYNSFN